MQVPGQCRPGTGPVLKVSGRYRSHSVRLEPGITPCRKVQAVGWTRDESWARQSSAAAADPLASAFTVGLGGIEPPTSAFHMLQYDERRPSNNPSELDFCGARWNRTIGLSIISSTRTAPVSRDDNEYPAQRNFQRDPC